MPTPCTPLPLRRFLCALQTQASLFWCAWLCVAAVAAPALPNSVDMRLPKKLIATGWDKADTQRLRENIKLMEQRPFDGVFFSAVGKNDAGAPVQLRPAHSNQAWKREWFRNCIADLKATKFTRFTDNFVSIGANPGDVDWFDDDGWKAVVDHWRMAAWIAKQSGTQGVHFDPEPYTKPYAQFSYQAQAEKGKHTFNEYYAKARERGQQVMQAVVEEYPGITVYCYFMNSVNISATGQKDPRQILVQSGYGLFPAFIDGWLDVAPPGATFVDGCETAYHFNSEREYILHALHMKIACQELVAPENRAKYRAQVQASFGVYLDAYWNPPTSPWHIDGLGGSRVERLRINTTSALQAADEYVWIYGEKNRWWPTPNGGVNKETWPEALPGSEDALRFARDPVEFARAKIAEMKKAGILINLARNADFGSDKVEGNTGVQQDWKEGGAPAGWNVWQVSDSQGVFSWDREVGASAKGAARASKVVNGCFIQVADAKPGELHAVRAVVRLQGESAAWVRVRWQTPENKWTQVGQDVILPVEQTDDEWREVFGVAAVPEGVGKIVLLLSMANQSAAQDVVWFDDVELYRLQ